MIAFQTCPPLLWSTGSGYDFFPWRYGFATALCKAEANSLFELRVSENRICVNVWLLAPPFNTAP
jgi:hypothetical protein